MHKSLAPLPIIKCWALHILGMMPFWHTLRYSATPPFASLRAKPGCTQENLYKVGGSLKRIKQAKNFLWSGKVDETISFWFF